LGTCQSSSETKAGNLENSKTWKSWKKLASGQFTAVADVTHERGYSAKMREDKSVGNYPLLCSQCTLTQSSRTIDCMRLKVSNNSPILKLTCVWDVGPIYSIADIFNDKIRLRISDCHRQVPEAKLINVTAKIIVWRVKRLPLSQQQIIVFIELNLA
jgi:hypothetical protein